MAALQMNFKCKKVRQGDPLSPFLFILAAEGLNWQFKDAMNQGLLNGLQVGGQSGPILTHLQFADDTLIFCQAYLDQIMLIRRLLRGFETMSDLRINYHKTVICGIGVDISLTESFAKILRCQFQCLPLKYLGMPLGVSPRLKSTWQPVLDKLSKRLSSSKRKHISFGGRFLHDEILIQHFTCVLHVNIQNAHVSGKSY